MLMSASMLCCLMLLLVSTHAGEVAPFCVGGEVMNSNQTASTGTWHPIRIPPIVSAPPPQQAEILF